MEVIQSVEISNKYNDVKNLIYSLCHKFQVKFGGDFEELVSEAHVAFMSAWRAFDPSEGVQFNTLLGTCVRNRLLDMFYRERTRKCVSLDQDRQGDTCLRDSVQDTYFEFDEDQFCNGLSGDSQYVIHLTLHPSEFVKKEADRRGGAFRNWRSAIRAHLQEVGWSYPRISETFKEIKSFL